MASASFAFGFYIDSLNTVSVPAKSKLHPQSISPFSSVSTLSLPHPVLVTVSSCWSMNTSNIILPSEPFLLIAPSAYNILHPAICMATSFLHLYSALISLNQKLSLSTISKIELYQSLFPYTTPFFSQWFSLSNILSWARKINTSSMSIRTLQFFSPLYPQQLESLWDIVGAQYTFP